MTLTRARVIAAPKGAGVIGAPAGASALAAPTIGSAASPPQSESSALPRARRVPSEVVDAAEQAQKLIRDAEARALVILQEAERRAAEAQLQAQAQGRADAMAELAARFLAQRSRELDSQQRGLTEQIQLARLLAERLLGEELLLHPERVQALARQTLSEAKGARSIVIEAHPDDVPLLEQSLGSLGVAAGAVTLRANPKRQRGNLLVITDAGTLDAALSPQLERLAQKLKETLST